MNPYRVPAEPRSPPPPHPGEDREAIFLFAFLFLVSAPRVALAIIRRQTFGTEVSLALMVLGLSLTQLWGPVSRGLGTLSRRASSRLHRGLGRSAGREP